ncbi:hypothetical protein [Foetidibacter luteolus]|uniref:hypothetical protein n=1 Tax=Foetidibacter luteolus TaxID=2608880 RepID=UPI00129B3CB7|nr:hypothetical protein [Foetidibacter luteolus]
MKTIVPVFVALLLLSFVQSQAQKRVFSYDFEFEKSFLEKSDYDAYFLDGKNSENFAFILKDNKKADYVLVDKGFKLTSKFTVPIDKTVFELSGETYLGGTTQNNVFNYVYKVEKKRTFAKDKIYYQLETVDFNSKTVTNKLLFEIPGEETGLVSFSDYNRYFTITVNDKTNELIIYMMDGAGEPVRKAVPFKIPEGKGRKKNELSEYLKDLKLVKDREEAGLDVTVKSAKVFTSKDHLTFLVNDGDDPTHLFDIDLGTLSPKEFFIDHDPLFPGEEKGKSYVSSYLADGKVFALVLNKKNIRIAVYDAAAGSMLKVHEINDNDDLGMFAFPPVYEERMGKHIRGKEYESLKKFVRVMTRGTEGLSVSKNKAGQYVVTAGTYDPIDLNSLGVSAGSGVGHWERVSHFSPISPTKTVQILVYRPGSPGFVRTSARFYKSSYFKLVLDPKTLKTANGKATVTAPEQIKEYLDNADKKTKATNQFSLGDNQYYGYYNRDLLAYTIEQITIRK